MTLDERIRAGGEGRRDVDGGFRPGAARRAIGMSLACHRRLAVPCRRGRDATVGPDLGSHRTATRDSSRGPRPEDSGRPGPVPAGGAPGPRPGSIRSGRAPGAQRRSGAAAGRTARRLRVGDAGSPASRQWRRGVRAARAGSRGHDGAAGARRGDRGSTNSATSGVDRSQVGASVNWPCATNWQMRQLSAESVEDFAGASGRCDFVTGPNAWDEPESSCRHGPHSVTTAWQAISEANSSWRTDRVMIVLSGCVGCERRPAAPRPMPADLATRSV